MPPTHRPLRLETAILSRIRRERDGRERNVQLEAPMTIVTRAQLHSRGSCAPRTLAKKETGSWSVDTRLLKFLFAAFPSAFGKAELGSCAAEAEPALFAALKLL